MPYKKHTGTEWLLLPLFVLVSFILYYTTLGRTFSSDDFSVVLRVSAGGKWVISGFFRPLSDLSIYFNYLWGGFNPRGFYAFSICLHGINAFLLFLFCRRWAWTSSDVLQRRFAWLSAALFLCYPFHNEAIVWVLGRGSCMAGTFGILSLLAIVSDISDTAKIIFVCLFFFAGLAAYESIVMLPVMVLIIMHRNSGRLRQQAGMMIAMAFTLTVHLILRAETSGSITGAYGKDFLMQPGTRYFSNVFKVCARLFLPPMENSGAFGWLSALVLLSGLVLILLLFRKRGPDRMYLLKIMLLLALACSVPVLSGVSTKTSESDRFLYFPSLMLCTGMGYVLVSRIRQVQLFAAVSVLICLYHLFFLEKNNANWTKASDITRNILQTIKSLKSTKETYLINLPDEYKGAYIFRHGLKEALTIDHTDSAGLVIINHLQREQMRNLPAVLRPVKKDGTTFIAPAVTISEAAGKAGSVRQAEGSLYLTPPKESLVLYWNNQALVPLP